MSTRLKKIPKKTNYDCIKLKIISTGDENLKNMIGNYLHYPIDFITGLVLEQVLFCYVF